MNEIRLNLLILVVMIFIGGMIVGASIVTFSADERAARAAMAEGSTHCVWAVPR